MKISTKEKLQESSVIAITEDSHHHHKHEHGEVGHACKKEANPAHACCGRCKAVLNVQKLKKDEQVSN